MTRGKAAPGEDAMRETDLLRMALEHSSRRGWLTKSESDAAAKRLDIAPGFRSRAAGSPAQAMRHCRSVRPTSSEEQDLAGT